MTSFTWRSLTGYIEKIAWVLFLVCLPITSFPYFPAGFGGGTLVRPLSLYPLLFLLILVVLPHLLTRPFPKTLVSLVPFLVVAVASTSLSLLQDIEPALGVSVLDRTIRGLITLVVGVAIYLGVALLPNSWDELRSTLRWIYAGFSLAMLWGSLQIVYILKYVPAYFRKLNQLQQLVSIRKLFQTRISGLTYEPNWYAEQISTLMLPWLIASVISGQSIFRWRWHKITIEWLLLAWAMANLAFTFSRAGFINLIVLSLAGFLIYRLSKSSKHTPRQSNHMKWLIRAGEVLLLLAVIIGLIFVVGRKSSFFSRIWNFWSERSDNSLENYIEYIGFGARTAYLETSLKIYEAYPFFGVGVGNFAFYFSEYYPDRPVAPTPEVLRILTPESGTNRLITPKNLYGRVLAEMGMAGLATLLVFLLAMFGCAWYTWSSPSTPAHYWGIASMLGLLVVVVSANSFDSFALPNMWVVFGLITAAASISDKESLIKSENPPGG
jgi:hypothetical protein